MTETRTGANTAAAAQTDPQGEIARLLAEASVEFAASLRALSETAPDKSTRKAARRALFTLSQKGIQPPAAEQSMRTAEEHRADGVRIWATAFDGAGNRMFFVFIAGEAGGAMTIGQILANDELGVRDLTLARQAAKRVSNTIAVLESRVDEGIVSAEVDADYGRSQIEAFRSLNVARSTMSPNGFMDFRSRMGAPPHGYAPPSIDVRIGDRLADVTDFPRDPESFFALPWFEPWFFDVHDVAEWIKPWLDLQSSVVEASAKVRANRETKLLNEAVESLMGGDMRRLFVTRLEESADVLARRGLGVAASQALHHAAGLRSDAPITSVEFAYSIVRRTIEAAAAIYTREIERTAAASGTSDG